MTLLIIIVVVIVVVGIIFHSNNQANTELNGVENIVTSQKIIFPDVSNPFDLLIFIRDADQKKIDSLHQVNFSEKIPHTIVKRAFVSRWRLEKIDYDYWLELLDEYEFNKKNGIKRKVRTKEELYLELVKNSKADGFKDTQVLSDFYLMDVLEIKGIHIGNRFSKIEKLERETELDLVKENSNQYDKYAVQIFHKNTLLGYVDRQSTKYVRRIMNNGYKCLLYDFYDDEGFKVAYYVIYLAKK